MIYCFNLERNCLNVDNVTFESLRDAEDAMEAMHGVRLHGRVIEIEFAQGERKSTSVS